MSTPYKSAQKSRTRHLKLPLLLLFGFFVVLLLLWPYFEKIFNPLQDETADKMKRLDQEKIIQSKELINPSFLSFDRKEQPFEVNSARAHHTADNHILLEKVRAKMQLEEGNEVSLSADEGQMETGPEGHVDLEGDVNLNFDTLYELKTEKAHVDIKNGTIEADVPVHAEGDKGAAQGEGLRFNKNKASLKLIGKSKVVLHDAK